MRFLLDAEQREFGQSVNGLLGAAGVPAAVRAWASGDHGPGRAVWSRLAGAGVFALAVPEAYGGVGRLPVEAVVAWVELGRHAVPGPVVETAAAAVLLAELAGPGGGDEGPAKEWLPRIASGEAAATLVGERYALDADAAELVLEATADGRLLARRPGSLAGPFASQDPARRLFRPSAGAGAASAASAGGTASATDAASAASAAGAAGAATGASQLAVGRRVSAAYRRAALWARLLTAAQSLGVARALLAQTVAYVGQRRQFGVAVGSFQAVKHRLADALIAVEFAQPLLYAAALSMDPAEVAMAKTACGEAGYTAARTALQLHGAIGYTEELDLSLWLRKARPLRDAWGSPAACRATALTRPPY
ncbi:acyl-CoA dehydrogenase [Phaeacidiphilus oryzae]|uniref:acyl-CoA dehydrogenase n=1 Tax=Phaeacidiphilus oryzae TaxID=348818 RepID=UPI00055C17F0|nr:acyl-CoA dehydrogenase [Phaeacidiphilus oryzae]